MLTAADYAAWLEMGRTLCNTLLWALLIVYAGTVAVEIIRANSDERLKSLENEAARFAKAVDAESHDD